MLLAAPLASAAPVGEAWVRLPPGGLDPAVLRTEHERVGADGVREVRVLGDLDALRALGLEVRAFRPDHRRGPPPEGYHHPDEGGAVLAALAARAPRAGRARLGTSVEGRAIDALWLGQPPGSGAPSYRVVGAHHGDEPISAEVVLALATALVDGDGPDPAITGLLDRATVWLVPFVNPDGVVAGSRFDANGVDLNRNHDFAWSPTPAAAGPRPFSEPETRAMRALGDLDRLTLGIAVHAGATNLGWPWNWTPADPPDAPALAAVAEVYAEACDTPGFWLTQGADWYVSTGDQNDWLYGRWGGLDLTLEVALHDPDAAGIARVVEQHLGALLAALAIPPAISGSVVDTASGLPVEARLAVEGRVAPFWSDPATGSFHHLATAEPGVLRVSAPGYAPAEVPFTPGAPVEVALAPVALREGRVEPPVLRAPGRVLLPEDPGGPVVLVRPGADDVSVWPAGRALALDPALLAPGFWSIVRPDGAVWPRALWVDGPEPGVAVDGWTVEGELACAWGAGFAEGARAWAVWGVARAPVELPVVSVAEGELCLSIAGIPADADPDVGIWTNGARLGLDHLWEDGPIALAADEALVATGGCACAPISGHRGAPALSIPFAGVAWLVRRRRS